ncbi:MAG: hypothetical protein Q4D87_08780 [Actinomycetaceae bacterium]|nr:hypothetical protein [Actinomycetaceae bacterium]
MNQPKRIPIAQRLKELNKEGSPARETTPTSVDAVSTEAFSDFVNKVNAPRTPALTVTAAGRLDEIAHRASVSIPVTPFEDASELDPETVANQHLFVVGPDVDPRELEALAVSIWDDAGWIEPGTLRLTGEATLSGPWKISKETRMQIGTPMRLEQAWIVGVPRIRTDAPAQFLQDADPVAHAFPDGMPAGKELEIIQALQRMARRLAGAIRVSPSGQIIEPDADSAVSMLVYAPRWVDEEDLSELLRPYLPDVVDSQDADKLPPIDSPSNAQSREELALKINIPEDELARIAEITRAADKKAMAEDFVVRGYSLLASAGNKSRVHITVSPAQFTPSALRFEQWPQGSAIEYGIHWIVPQIYMEKMLRPSRAVRFERNRVKDQIELIATLITRSTGGHVLDEDQFLVADPH